MADTGGSCRTWNGGVPLAAKGWPVGRRCKIDQPASRKCASWPMRGPRICSILIVGQLRLTTSVGGNASAAWGRRHAV